MDRTERLLDLVMTLLDAPEPVTFASLREWFPAYRGSPAAAERKFERDKATLVSLGIPLRAVTTEADRTPGYVLASADYAGPRATVSRSAAARAALGVARAGSSAVTAQKAAWAARAHQVPALIDAVQRSRSHRQPQDAGARAARLLALLPFLPGRQRRLRELAAELGLEHQVLARDLRTLALVGKPPFTPGDYIDVTLERGRVTAGPDPRFARPPQLTLAELETLEPRPALTGLLRELASAVLRRRELALVHGGSPVRLKPERLFQHRERWYLAGRDSQRRARRVLQVEHLALA